MKKFLIALTVLTLFLLFSIIYEKYFIQSEFGPSAMLAVTLLVCFAVALLATLFAQGTRFQETVTRLWLVSISIGVTFIVLDLVVGTLLIKPLSPELAPDNIRHHKLVPNTYSRFEQRDFSYIQRVNNLGLRGKDTTIEKPDNLIRILMLGDSFTMGKGVEDDQTFSAFLEEIVNKNGACNNKRIEILNGGVDSYSPVLSYLQLTNDLAPLKPDLIILNLDNSDLLQETVYRNIAIRDSTGEILGVPGQKRSLHFNQRLRQWIDQNLYFTRLILYYTNQALGHRDLTVQGVVARANLGLLKHTLSTNDIDHGEQWSDIFRSITKIKQFADRNSVSFALAIYPWGHQVNDQEWVPGRYGFLPETAETSDNYLDTIQYFADQSDIQFVNLIPFFRQHNSKKRLYFSHDMHWTIEGHKLMASGLYSLLIEEYLRSICARY